MLRIWTAEAGMAPGKSCSRILPHHRLERVEKCETNFPFSTIPVGWRPASGGTHVTVRNAETSVLTYARVAGLLYLIIIVAGLFSEMFVRSSLIVPGDAAATASNILASEGLFRIGFVADAIMLLSDVAIAVLFYALLKPVSPILALMAAAFRLVQAAVLGFNLLNYHAVLLLLSGGGYAAAFEAGQLHELVMLFLDMHGHGYDLGLLFFALSNAVLGYLVVKSDRFPGILGVGLMASAAVYMLGSFTHFLFPDHLSAIAPLYLVPLIAELSLALWLLVKGGRLRPSGNPAH